jgi:hypothetical protein
VTFYCHMISYRIENNSTPPQSIIAPPFAKGGAGVGYFLWQLIKN